MSDTHAETLQDLVDEFLEALFNFHPRTARYKGLHLWDGHLPERSGPAMARRVQELGEISGAEAAEHVRQEVALRQRRLGL